MQRTALPQRSVGQVILTCLKAMGRDKLALKTDWPKYTEKKVRAYSEDEIKKLLAAADDEERLLFQFFLYSGAREQEVQFACWDDIDFRSKTYAVREKRDLGFKPKDREERVVPFGTPINTGLRRHISPGFSLLFLRSLLCLE